MPSDNDDKFATFTLPDISKVDATKISLFKRTGTSPKWRRIGRGLNLEGICKQKSCQAKGKKVWTSLGYGTFSMGEQVCKCTCPICGKPTKGNKRIAIYRVILTGRGMKVRKNIDSEETDDDESNQSDDDEIL